MEQYIPKSALVAEIEKRIGNCAKQREDMLNVQCYALADDASARMGELNCIKDFLDTLEVKEVDLEEKACDAYCKVCGHYAHTTPNHICRQACDYYKNFVNYLKGK